MLKRREVRKACWPSTREPQKRALAGVGRPMNWVLWRTSRLNLASLRAEKAARRKAV